MHSSRLGNSTRLRPTRSGQKQRQQPTRSKRSNLGAEPRYSLEAMEARLTGRKPLTGLGTTAVDVLREMRDGVPAAELRRIRDALELICSCAIVVEHALMEQNCELDGDAASMLKRYVGDQLVEQIQRLDTFLAAVPGDDDEEAGRP